MSNEKLLEPRYLVIADYPCSIYKIGKMFKREGNCLFYEGVNHYNFIKPQDFPHLFRKLEWWEERNLNDLPNYLSYVSITLSLKYYGQNFTSNPHALKENFEKARRFQKVDEWFYEGAELKFMQNGVKAELFWSTMPATEQQYLSQQNKSKVASQ